MHDDLDLRVLEQLAEPARILVRERVDRADQGRAAGAVIGGHLHKAQQRVVAPLGHELRVEREPAGGGRSLRQFLHRRI